MKSNPPGSSPRTSPAGSLLPTLPSAVSWEHLWEQLPHSRHPAEEPGGEVRVWSADRSTVPRGASSTLRASCRKGDGAFFWSAHGRILGEIPSECFAKPKPKLRDILESGPIAARYFLSPKSAAGILRRAKHRGRELPVRLMDALQALVDAG